jgi:4-oxalocrotonate tautomerase
MPIIRVELLKGRSVEQKREFAELVTREGARILKCTPEAIDVVFAEIDRSDWATGGVLQIDRKG